MSFLSQSILWGLLATTIPVVIHLLNRRRFRTVKWAASSFLLKASRESRGKKKLKHLLILTCRTLAIASLIFAVARPLIGGFLASSSSSAKSIILILDRSASMEMKNGSGQPSQRQSALKKISHTLKKIGSPQLLLIDSATGQLHDIPDPQTLSELTLTSATDTHADIPKLLTTAISHLEQTQTGPSEIWLASDLQHTDWQPSDSRWGHIRSSLNTLSYQTKLRILTSRKPDIENLNLHLLTSRRVGDQLLLDLKITRHKKTSPLTLPLTYSLNGTRFSERVTIKGSELRLQKRLPLHPSQPEGYGWATLPADHNPRDNSIYFAFGEQEPLQTWLISEDPTGESAHYLSQAAAPTGLPHHTCYTLSPTQSSQISWPTASLIIWHAPIPTGAAASQLTHFVHSGGSVLFLPPTQQSDHAIFGTAWGKLQAPPQGEFFINGNWIKDEGPWKNGQNQNPMPLDQIRAIQRRAIIGNSSPLAEWDDASALLSRQLEGNGTAIFINTLPDERWSNLEFTALHLVAIQRLLEKGSDRLHTRYHSTAGHENATTKNHEVREKLDDLEPFAPALGPYRAGVYRLGERTLAINRPSEENSAEQIDQKTLDQLLDGTPYTLFENEHKNDKLVAEAWRAFLIAVLLFLLAEALLCLQPPATSSPLRSAQPSPKPTSSS